MVALSTAGIKGGLLELLSKLNYETSRLAPWHGAEALKQGLDKTATLQHQETSQAGPSNVVMPSHHIVC